MSFHVFQANQMSQIKNENKNTITWQETLQTNWLTVGIIHYSNDNDMFLSSTTENIFVGCHIGNRVYQFLVGGFMLLFYLIFPYYVLCPMLPISLNCHFLIVLSVFSNIYIEQNNYIGNYQTTIVFFVSHQLSGNYLNMQVVIYFPHLKTSDKYLHLP